MVVNMVNYRVQSNVAILQVNNPPVNALSFPVRHSCQDALRAAMRDDAVHAVVLCGAGGKFLGGADIKEFNSADNVFLREPHLLTLCNDIEGSSKPVVAAIEGFALGGGLEVAISAHYRVADSKSRFGFPEVSLGLLPAASGTQRFPRLVGVKSSMELIASGRQFDTKEALSLGVIDKVVTEDVLKAAIDLAKSAAAKTLEGRRTSKLIVKDADLAEKYYLEALKMVERQQKGLDAPKMCLQAVLASAQEPFDEGVRTERRLARVLFASKQAAALQYAFFATRAAPKWHLPGGASYRTVKPQQIASVAVIGAGTMGTGIAMSILAAGINVTLVEQSEKFLNKGVAVIRAMIAGSVQRGKMTSKQAEVTGNLLTPSLNYDDIKNVDMVIECVFEDMTVKKAVFRKLDEATSPHTILCSNTSSLDIDQLAAATTRPALVMGAHFFSPANIMRLLENVHGKDTSPQTVATVMNFGLKIKKVPVLVGNCRSFVANRMCLCYWNEACVLLEEGASPQQIDAIMEEFGMKIGPFKTLDLAGIDICVSVMSQRADVRTSGLMALLAERGRLGRKTGKGWYNYGVVGGKVAAVDPWVGTMLTDYRRRHAIVTRDIPSQEIVERLLYGMLNVGFMILDERMASKPEDIDTIFLLGFGWPRHRGGPMYYSSEVGLRAVSSRLQQLYTAQPTTAYWQPSSLLKRLAADDAPMSKWMTHVSESVPASRI